MGEFSGASGSVRPLQLQLVRDSLPKTAALSLYRTANATASAALRFKFLLDANA
jgi:hypothetical protein